LFAGGNFQIIQSLEELPPIWRDVLPRVYRPNGLADIGGLSRESGATPEANEARPIHRLVCGGTAENLVFFFVEIDGDPPGVRLDLFRVIDGTVIRLDAWQIYPTHGGSGIPNPEKSLPEESQPRSRAEVLRWLQGLTLEERYRMKAIHAPTKGDSPSLRQDPKNGIG